jgi:hypothetical protein
VQLALRELHVVVFFHRINALLILTLDAVWVLTESDTNASGLTNIKTHFRTKNIKVLLKVPVVLWNGSVAFMGPTYYSKLKKKIKILSLKTNLRPQPLSSIE